MTKKYRNKKQRTKKTYSKRRYTRKNKIQYGGKERKNVKKPTQNNLMKTLDNEFSSGFFVIDTGLGRSAQPNRIKKLENIFFQREQAKNNTPQEKLSSVKVKPQQKNSGDTLMGAMSRGLTEGRQARSQVQTALSTARSSIDSITSGMGVPEARISNSLSGIGKQVGMLGKSQGKKTKSRGVAPVKTKNTKKKKGRNWKFWKKKKEEGEPTKIEKKTVSPKSTEAEIPQTGSPGQRREQPKRQTPTLRPQTDVPPTVASVPTIKENPNLTGFDYRDVATRPQTVLSTGVKLPSTTPKNTIQNSNCPCCGLPVNDPNVKICDVTGGNEENCIEYFKKKGER